MVSAFDSTEAVVLYNGYYIVLYIMLMVKMLLYYYDNI